MGRISVATQNEASDFDQQMIVLREPTVRNMDGDPQGTLQMILCCAALCEDIVTSEFDRYQARKRIRNYRDNRAAQH